MVETWADDSDVTVATGNSRHYQPLRRIARRHRRKSSNLLFSTFFLASRSFWSRRTILPLPSPCLPSSSRCLFPLLFSLRQSCPIQRLDENGLRGRFHRRKKKRERVTEDGRKHERKLAAPTTSAYLADTLSSTPLRILFSVSPRFSGRLGSSLLILPAIFKHGRTLVTCKNICDCVICTNFIYIRILIYIYMYNM